MSGDNKKAFQTAHTSVPVYYPDELALVGGRTHLDDPRQHGPLDTAAPKDDDADPLYRPNRLTQPFKIGFIESIDANGVMQEISIVLRDSVPTVEFGQTRTRAARIANYERKQRCGVLGKSDREAQPACTGAGWPLLSIRCAGKKARDDVQTLSRILAENHLRHDDDLETTIETMKKLLDATNNDFELVARQAGVKPPTVKRLLKFDEHATKETRKAVAAGRIGITAAALLANEPDGEKQNKLLAELLGAADQSVKRARALNHKNKGQAPEATLTGKRQFRKFKEFVAAERDQDPFYDGVLALLELQTAGTTSDPRLAEVFKRFEGTPPSNAESADAATDAPAS